MLLDVLDVYNVHFTSELKTYNENVFTKSTLGYLLINLNIFYFSGIPTITTGTSCPSADKQAN